MSEVPSLLMFGVPFAVLLVVVSLVSIMFRRVVSTNMVHIVQSRRKTSPFGTGQAAGNVYYQWPSWVPFFGVTVIALPVSNFDISLKGYEAYDKDRVPFMVDVVAFFRIKDTACAAQRVSSIEELKAQLQQIVQGAVRKVLASALIDTIMLERAQFGEQFTNEVREQLKEWGTDPVKSMELMDIRDSHESKVISNIMAKKTSHIEMESRIEVAKNTKNAQTAEIEAKQQVAVRTQESEEAVARRTAQKEQAVGIAQQQSRQEVLTQEKVTRERDMEVKRVQEVKTAEITRDQQVVAAEQDKQTRIIRADGDLEAKRKEATGVQVLGEAKAAAEKAMQLAPVQAQITLAQEIGNNAGYQQYLAMIEAIKAYMEVGGKQAEALQNADVKVIANAGSPTSGMSNVMDLFTSKGGTELSGMVEAFAQTPVGKATLGALGVKTDTDTSSSK
ncbi:MAG: hypothetical protein HYT62_04885 [Candidatus Yanofskybacteria bacterium]|nr:hypothetical protein [Candidatus Yanofskybacteria bacterium]